MWWLGIPVAIGAVVAITKIISGNETKTNIKSDLNKNINQYIPEQNKTLLETNLIKLKTELQNNLNKKKVLFVGQPGAGKSSLIRSTTFLKCKPLPEVGISTDQTDWSQKSFNSIPIINYQDKFIIIDSPGYDTKNHPIGSFMKYFPFEDFEKIILVFNNKLHKSDNDIIRKFAYLNAQIDIVRTFSENLSDRDKIEIEEDINKNFYSFTYRYSLHFVSNKTKHGIDELVKLIFK